jgi:hypothetical protein
MKRLYTLLVIIILGFTAKSQTINDWSDRTGDGLDDGFSLISGRPHIMGSSYFTGSAQHIESNSQIAFKTNFKIKDGLYWHLISFKYVASRAVRFVVFFTPTCGWNYFTLPPAETPQYISIKYWAPTQDYLLWYNAVSGDVWFELDEVCIDQQLKSTEEPTIVCEQADTTDLGNDKLIRLGQNSSGVEWYDLTGRQSPEPDRSGMWIRKEGSNAIKIMK